MEIKLTQGRFSVIDDADSHLAKLKWFYAHNSRPTGYAYRNMKVDGRWKLVALHHAVVGFPLHGKQVDHINGNRLDNRRENLRVVSMHENAANRHYVKRATKAEIT